jgi:plasmid stabilization system protein ParE
MARKVIWSDEAITDLGMLVTYIAADNRSAAEALGRAIFERTRTLAEFPQAGRIVPEFREPNLREFIVYPYRVIYELNVAGTTVDVLRIWHAARDRPELQPPTR